MICACHQPAAPAFLCREPLRCRKLHRANSFLHAVQYVHTYTREYLPSQTLLPQSNRDSGLANEAAKRADPFAIFRSSSLSRDLDSRASRKADEAGSSPTVLGWSGIAAILISTPAWNCMAPASYSLPTVFSHRFCLCSSPPRVASCQRTCSDPDRSQCARRRWGESPPDLLTISHSTEQGLKSNILYGYRPVLSCSFHESRMPTVLSWCSAA
jgi:hypothetical protein